MKSFRVMENNKILLETCDKREALASMRSEHRKDRTKFHEVHEWNILRNGAYCGTNQLAPNDCPDCGRRPETCVCVNNAEPKSEGHKK